MRRFTRSRVPAGVGTFDAAALDRRCQGLRAAAQAASGRLPADPVAAAERVLDHVAQRRRFADDLTVVAVAGPTGAGKSTLFNALVGLDVAHVGVTRPTTDAPTAALWTTTEAAGPLLEWLGVGRWHRVAGPSEGDDGQAQLEGLVLLDLPDHDSTAAAHRRQVDLLVARADMMIWVLDPQKYADALVHDAYLARFARHDEVTVVLLNQVDRLSPADAVACREHLAALVAEDGLRSAPILGTSARTGQGLQEVRGLLGDAVRERHASLRRLGADVAVAAAGLREVAADTGEPIKPMPSDAADRLAAALADAAGVGLVTTAVRDSVRRSGARATGWPAVRWVHGLRADPAARLRLSRPGVPASLVRTSIPSASPVALAAASASARDYAARASAGAPPDWVRSSRAVAVSAAQSIGPHLDAAVAQAEVATPRPPRWWALVGALQWLLLAAAAVGAVWLIGLVVLGALAIPAPDPPTVAGLPVPTILLLGGSVAGIVLGALARSVTRVTADRAAGRARATITTNVARVAKERVVDPVSAELQSVAQFRTGIEAALGD